MKFFVSVFCFFIVLSTISCVSKKNITEIDDGKFIWKKGSFQIEFNNKWSVISQKESEVTFAGDGGVFIHIFHSPNMVSYEVVSDKLLKNSEGGGKKITDIEETVFGGKKSLYIRGYTVISDRDYSTEGYFYSGQEGSIFITGAYPKYSAPSPIAQMQKFLDGFSIQ